MASGDTLAVADITAGFPPAADYATHDTLPTSLIPVLDFDDATDETMYFKMKMPGQYDGSSALDVAFEWKFETFVGSQTVDWEVSFKRMLADTDDWEVLTGFAASQDGTNQAEASATKEMVESVINFTNAEADGVQGGDWFLVKFTRDASGGTQSSPGDAQLAGFEVRYA